MAVCQTEGARECWACGTVGERAHRRRRSNGEAPLTSPSSLHPTHPFQAHRKTSHRDNQYEERKRAAHSGIRSSGEATELAYAHMGPTHRERAMAKKLAVRRPVGGGAHVVIHAHAPP